MRTKQTKTVYYMLFIVHKVHILLYSLPMAHVKAYPKSCWVRVRARCIFVTNRGLSG